MLEDKTPGRVQPSTYAERTIASHSGEEERGQGARAAVGGSERELRRATPDSQGSQEDSSDGRQNSQAKSEDDKEKREAWGRYCWML